MHQDEVPSWVDAAFVQEALRRAGDEDTVVKAVTLRPVGAPGDHYASAMFRITAETSDGTKPIIIKTVPENEALEKLTREIGIFHLESFVLSEVIPKIHELLEDAAPGRFSPLAAKCPHYGDEPHPFLFLEDLEPQGFRLADRHRGLGLRHSLLALRALARFHAASAALLSKDPTIPEKIPNQFRQMNNPAMRAFVESGWQCLADVCRKWKDFPSEFADAVAAAKVTAFERYQLINDYRPDRFNVIVHGDFWINNMMFRYEDQEVRDIRLVDLQLSHVTTPAIDILYFFGTSVTEDVYVNHRELLVREYHVTLRDTMELLGLEAPSLDEFLTDLNESGIYSTFGSFLVLPIVKTQEIPDMEKYLDSETTGNKFMYAGPSVERWLRRIIPEYVHKGWLK